MPYAIDPELAPWVAMLPDFDLSDVHRTRELMAAVFADLPPYVPSEPLETRDAVVPGPAGAPDVPVRIYRPASWSGTGPGLLYLHGGGFVLGNVAEYGDEAAGIAAEVGAVVVSVEYRLAPEHPFPAGPEDCYAALVWVAKNAAELGIDPTRLGVGGESAGGALAAAVALMARDRGGPALCFQWVGTPMLDDRLDTPSALAFTDTPGWNRPCAEYGWGYYLGPDRGPDVSPYAAPARATDLSGLPPAYITTCHFDPLRDEGLRYAERLILAGVATELHHYPGTIHGARLVSDASIGARMSVDLMGALRRGLGAA